ncbi:DUF4168 domain-containing protein [Allopusillimonas ginsengisoli]|uniref:DUF4168 domain-containing protein n=1 Tax=Allopusillimonas ginsengisoli TaxID=453575 RepID=UPI00101F1AB2|nr:DUF4168 domain-containing protein [Allopusillimonas ginsengisoli]TEA79511.1 DUF4168 domain-containing protein [Allopusillimonas ginsengisoli]
MHKRISNVISGCLLAAGLVSGAAMAQQSAAPAAAPQAAAPAANYSDVQLKQFVNASQKVAMISQEYTPKLEAAKDDAGKKQVFEEADAKMVDAVHKEGMTVDQFNGINQALQQDPKLVERVQQMVQ